MHRVLTLVLISFTLIACQTAGSKKFSYTSTNVVGEYWSPYFKKETSFPINLSGKLYLPEGEGPFPVVVWGSPTTRDSEALAQWRSDLRSELLSNGIGIIINDSYTGRGLGKRVTSGRLNSSSRYFDNARLLGALSKHPKIDARRIGIAGASYGANIAMRLQWEYYMDKVLPNGPRYAAHVPIYPPCNAIIKSYESTDAPMLILIGEKDYNDANRCKDRVRELRADGAKVDLVIYPGAYHCFLSTSPVRLVYTPVYKNCGIKVLDVELGYEDRINVRAVKNGQCYENQGMCGGNSLARRDALKRTVSFFVKNL